ncbi:hypothetical protein ACFY2K_42875 [Kitasatospora sp. NPDC001309]|uniref:hypothetical protein n=1 Tax=Kitasatospora sp. NPDC001309 TaxID=3364013 RepID=UPI0036A51E0A
MTPQQITDADLIASLIPADAAALDTPSPAVPLTVAYTPGDGGVLVPVYIPVPLASNAAPGATVAPHSTAQAPAVRDAGPLVPRWAVGTAVASVGVGAGAWLLAGALHLADMAVTGLVAGASAGLPLLVVAGVAVAALAGRRSSGGTGGVHVVQTITQTITNRVHIGE